MVARTLIAVLLVARVLAADVAFASPEKCTAAIIKAGAAFVQGRAKAQQACEQAKLGGKLPGSTVCANEPKTSAKLAKGRDKLAKAITAACGGKDKVCGGANAADDEDLAAIGWAIGTCPDFESGDCTNAIASCADIPVCLACVSEGAVDQAIGVYYAALQPTDPKSKDKAVKALRKCQTAIGKASTVFLAAKSKALAACWGTVAKNGGTCPDAKAVAAIAAAQAKQAATIQKTCAGLDKVPGTADDPTPATIGFAETCFDVAGVDGASCGGPVDTLAQLVSCVDCVTQLNLDCADRAGVPAFAADYPDECNGPGIIRRACEAQRTVHVVAGIGSLGWFTQVWPLPIIITAPNASYSFDDPAKAQLVPGTEASHPLYARVVGGHRVWDGLGAHGEPSIFVASVNQTHTNSPTTTRLAGGPEIVAAGAVLQTDLATSVPVLSFGTLPYGDAPGAPPAVVVADVAAAIAAIKAATPIAPDVEQGLQPSSATLASWGIDGGTPAVVVTFAQRLLFAANAFRFGLVGTVLLPGFNDDPHGAFDTNSVTARADILVRVLDGFYGELAAHREPRCGVGGLPPSLADNVVMVVSGDTYKNPFERAGWSDGTPGNSNLLIVRSNGFVKPGWFGAITPGTRTNFDPTTGELAPSASPGPNHTPSTTAAQLGLLYAITRGNTAVVAQVSAAPYAGVIQPVP